MLSEVADVGCGLIEGITEADGRATPSRLSVGGAGGGFDPVVRL